MQTTQQTPIDLLQIRIEKAKSELPEDTINAIDAIDWKMAILGLRAKKGYTFEQLGDLELETELLLCGLLSPEDYPKELENRMRISRAQADELVSEMNDLVFKKIKEELIKNTERKKIFANKIVVKTLDMLKPISAPTSSIPTTQKETLPIPKKLELETIAKPKPASPSLGGEETHPVRSPEGSQGAPTSNGTHPILIQKISGSFQIPMVKTEYSLNNISKNPAQEVGTKKEVKTPVPQAPKVYPKNGDPYRLSAE